MKTEYRILLEHANELNKIAELVKNELDDLKNYYSKIGADGEVWGGDAAESARADLDVFSSKFDGFYNTIVATSNNLKNIVSNYVSADKKVVNMQ